jgi:uncharacterized protein YdaU (DUF1376 family)
MLSAAKAKGGFSMVAFYKHNIPDWRDGTCNLSDGAYRVYHQVCMMIYLNEGPITLHERGIAGACNQRIDRFRHYLKECLTTGKLTLTDGLLHNKRCSQELHSILDNRSHASLGGIASAKSRKYKAQAQAPLEVPMNREEKTRLEKTREEAPSYGWARRVIKLSVKDYEEWKRIFPHLDLDAELVARDAWLENQPPSTQKQWFGSTSALLNKRNTHARIASQQQSTQTRRNVDEKGRDIQYVGGIRLDYVT